MVKVLKVMKKNNMTKQYNKIKKTNKFSPF